MVQQTAVPTPVTIFQHPQLGPAVSGRELYSKATISRSSRNIFSDWFRFNERKVGLTEGKDFVSTTIPNPDPNGKKGSVIEHIVTVDAAAKVAQIQTAKRGLGVVAFISEYKRSGTTQTAVLTQVAPTSLQAPELPLQGTNAPETVETTPAAVIAPNAPVLTPAQELLQKAQKLVDEEQARAKAEKETPSVPAGDLTALTARLDATEKRLNVVLYFFQQASHALRTLPPAQLPTPVDIALAQVPSLEPTTRAKVNRLVDAYAAAKMVTHQEVWKHLYGQLSTITRFDPWVYGQGKKDPNYLEIVEEHGQLENLYAIAQQALSLNQN